MKGLTDSEFIGRSKERFGNRFDYSKVVFKNMSTKVRLKCNVCGNEFDVVPSSHLNRNGCPWCSGLKQWDTEAFIKKSKEINGDRYNYDKTKYVNKRTNVIITCPIHGDFSQNPHNHIVQKQGCPECGKLKAQETHKGDYEQFVKGSKERFGDLYTFPDIEMLYGNSHSKILIKCKKCGTVFNKIACDHLTSANGGCPKCYAWHSAAEVEIGNFLKDKLPNELIVLNDRTVLNGRELDIYIPSRKVAIEYNGVFWHSEANNKAKDYHLTKTEWCKAKGIRLIQIFEDEYFDRKEIVLSKIEHILGISCNLPKIMGRKCEIKEIKKNKAYDFLNVNHIQGFASATVYLGAFYDDYLVGVMTFVKNGDKWELNRFASDNTKICQGVGGKLFKYFVKNYKPLYIKSFADRRWTTNENDNLYIKLGFIKEEILPPDYRYVLNGKCKRFHKFNFRKQTLHKKYGLPLSMTEAEMTKAIGAHKIWDCGLIKYVWKKEN